MPLARGRGRKIHVGVIFNVPVGFPFGSPPTIQPPPPTQLKRVYEPFSARSNSNFWHEGKWQKLGRFQTVRFLAEMLKSCRSAHDPVSVAFEIQGVRS